MANMDKRLLIKIAHYYYKLGLTQEEIAKKLNMSRQRVNRLSKRLLDEGIVKITINCVDEFHVELENTLEKRFNLKEVVVISRIESENIEENLGAAGATYLNGIIQDNMVLGVSWGSTLSSVASNMNKTTAKNLSVVQLVGGINLGDASIKADEITRSIAGSLDAKPYLMYAPAIVKDSNVKDAIMSEESVKNIFNKISQCDVAIVGIGSLNENSTLFKQKYIDKDHLDELMEKKSVGDICLSYYDIDGKITHVDNGFYSIGISLGELRKIKQVIGIAGGDNKAEAIYGALKGGYIDVLITDNITAEAILNIDDRR